MTPPRTSLPLRANVPLAELGTFRLGGPTRWLAEPHDAEELARLRRETASWNIPSVLLGEGSNLLFADEGWPGLAVRFVNPLALPRREDTSFLRVSAALPLDSLAAWSVQQGLDGLVAFSGIPGTVGGATVGNAGAWGLQMEDVIDSLWAIDPHGEILHLFAADCGFSYRDSRLKDGNLWVTEVRVRVTEGDPTLLRRERERILALRAGKHPDWRVTPCIGSFFRNVEPSSAAERRRAAGWFLETAGVKSLRVGGAGIFPHHANIPVKLDESCLAQHVAELARRMRECVQRAHGLDLVREVRYLGKIPGEAGGPTFH